MGVVLTDDEGRIKDANAAFLHLLGYTRQNLERGLTCAMRVAPGSRGTVETGLPECATNGSFGPAEKTLLTRAPPLLHGPVFQQFDRLRGEPFPIEGEPRKASAGRVNCM